MRASQNIPARASRTGPALATGQKPTAVVFGCADSRVAAEIIFDQGLGDMFVVRTAGHVIDSAVLGSIEYAVTVLNVPLIVVLGHDSCGAVKATLSALDDGVMPGGYVRDIVERVTPSILMGRHAGLTRVDEFEARHVNETAAQLRIRSAPIAERHRGGHAGDRRRHLSPGRRPGGVAGLSGRHRRRLTGDTPSHLGRSSVTWPYREVVLDLEPHGPLPTQIYWRRRALALGIAVLVIGVVAAVVVDGRDEQHGHREQDRRQADPNAGRRARRRFPGRIPRSRRRSMPPASAGPAADAHPDRGRHAAAGAQGGRRLPRLHAGGQGHHQPAAVRRRRPAEVHHGRHQHRPGRLQARRRRRGAGGLRVLAGQQAAVVEPRLRAVERDAGQDVQARASR